MTQANDRIAEIRTKSEIGRVVLVQANTVHDLMADIRFLLSENDSITKENRQLESKLNLAKTGIKIEREKKLKCLDQLRKAREELEHAHNEIDRLNGLINSPETEDWMKGVPLEAAHQAERWSEHDPEKTSLDWFWLIGYLAQKAAYSQIAGDIEKTKHHTISTAATLLNWHRTILTQYTEKGDQPDADICL